MNKQVRPADIVIMASGAVAILFSFFTWFDAEDLVGESYSAWSGKLFPLATYIAVIGLVMGLQVALDRFANVNFPDRVLGFTWPQIHLALAVFAGLLAIGWLIANPFDFPGASVDKGIGLWFSILAAIGLIVGAVMQHLEAERGTGVPGNQPPTPF